jgi:putative polyketide hydroxylase
VQRSDVAGLADATAQTLGIPIDVYVIAASGDVRHPCDRWPDVYGADSHGAVLIRPDGFVLWQSPHGEADAKGTLVDVLTRTGLHSADRREAGNR